MRLPSGSTRSSSRRRSARRMAELSGREMNEASQKHLCGHCAYTLRHYARHACVTCKLRKAQGRVHKAVKNG
eukprot:scaffold20949_cov62-Phaeocystis_antarctica.AAC.1